MDLVELAGQGREVGLGGQRVGVVVLGTYFLATVEANASGRAVSAGGCERECLNVAQEVFRDLFGGAVVEHESGPLVEFGGRLVEHGLIVDTQIAAFGEVLADQPVGVLIGRPLPWGVGVAEVDVDAGGLAEVFVEDHLVASVPDERLADLGRHELEPRSQRVEQLGSFVSVGGRPPASCSDWPGRPMSQWPSGELR